MTTDSSKSITHPRYLIPYRKINCHAKPFNFTLLASLNKKLNNINTLRKGEKSEIKIESVADDGAYDETTGTADPPQYQYCNLKITITPANKEKNITVRSLKKQYGNVEVNEIPQQQ